MTHDPEVYEDPTKFNPERFLEIDGKQPEMDPTSVVFGFGRRACPGRILADNTLYLSIAQSLAVFKITKGAEDVDLRPEFQPGVISHPVPWECKIESRSPEHETLINTVLKECPFEESDSSELEKI